MQIALNFKIILTWHVQHISGLPRYAATMRQCNRFSFGDNGMKIFLMDCIDEEGAPENILFMRLIAWMRLRLRKRDSFAETMGDRRLACKTILKRR